MRHIKLIFKQEQPSEKEIYEWLKRSLGIFGVVNGEIRVKGDIVSCGRKWVDKVVGALALKWQFKFLVSGTLNKLSKKEI